MSFIFAKSLKGKLMLMTSIPILALVIIGFMSYLSIQGQVKRSEELTVFIPLSSDSQKIVGHSHALPRYIWLALGNDANKEKRMEYVKKASDELNKMKDDLKSQLDLVEKNKHDLSLSMMVQDSLRNLSEPISHMDQILTKVKEKFEAMDPEQDKAVKHILLTEVPPVALKISQELQGLEQSLDTDTQAYLKSSAEKSAQSFLMRMLITGVSILISIAVSVLFAINISRRILQVTDNVSDSTKQVASASHQIANASQQLAAVSQTQASSIEETSAALAEMSGMVEKNTRNAETTAQLAQNVQTQSEQSVAAMAELIKSMHEILESNKKIETLVKVIEEIGEKTSVIDEIVFQTKLLSFNASVEAERAGEHGRGFAVVAQEVGNLAQMSGRSALEISAIVKTSVKEASQIAQENRTKVEQGNRLVEMTEKVLKEMEGSAKNVLDLSEQVMNASKEQNTGINQINSSVDNISKTTQETASTAEESASAAEELSSQSTTLQNMVQDLKYIVTGAASPTESGAQVIAMPEKKKEVSHLKLAVGGTKSTQLGSWEKL